MISQQVDEPSGSTATALLIDNEHIYCVSVYWQWVIINDSQWIIKGNIGDSRAIASYDGHCCPLSFDHKPSRPDEVKRIEVRMPLGQYICICSPKQNSTHLDWHVYCQYIEIVNNKMGLMGKNNFHSLKSKGFHP